MVDSHSGGDSHVPRHADPWWMNDPESMAETHVYGRHALEQGMGSGEDSPSHPGMRRALPADDDPSYEPTHALHPQDSDAGPDLSTAARDRERIRRAATDDGSSILDAQRRWTGGSATPGPGSDTPGYTDADPAGHARHKAPETSDLPDDRERVAYRRSAIWTTLGALVPGLGLWASRQHAHRRFGRIITGLALVCLTVVAVIGVVNPALLASVAVRPRLLNTMSVLLPLMAVALVALLVFTHIHLRPLRITHVQRWISALLVGTLSLVIAAPLAISARYARDESVALSKIFAGGRSGTRPSIDYSQSAADIWKQKPRVNVLLVGADDSSARDYRQHGEMNTDSMMVASIDTQTGNTTLIQVPRNLADLPFPADSALHKIYPDGFTNGHGDDENFFANEVWSTVETQHKDAMGATDYPGADALKLGMGEALGLDIDYFVMLDIDGLQKFVDAVGGVTVNVNERIPIAGNTEGKVPTGYIEIGPDQHLDGYRAMWYARSRSASTDYDRMGRQSCLIKAVLDQVSPQTVLTRFESLAAASGEMVVSDIPQEMLPAFVELAMRMRGANINRLLFTQGKNGFVPYQPDYPVMRTQVKQAILDASDSANKNRPVTSASPRRTPAPTPTPTPTPTRTPTSTPTPTPTPVSQSVTDVCAYNPIQK